MVHTGLHNKIVLITGANHGIGAATARAFAAEGAAVLINYLRMPPMGRYAGGEAELDQYDTMRAKSADEVVQAIRALGGRAEAVEADLADVTTIPLLFDRAEALFGPVDVLVNNADHCEQSTFIPVSQIGPEVVAPDGYPTYTVTAEEHDRHFAVNSRALALMMAEFARRRIERGIHWGRIITMSTDGAPGFTGTISYGASKYAAESYTRAAALELGKYGITANIVSPGPTQTGWIRPELEEAIINGTPLGRVGQPEDIADVIVFLASEQARWVTAQMISVSGGCRIF
ncbi:MAG: SDR family oxidoreductase [Ktedonobacteraceae bacterium]|nr:SDR family oxidoreductase [Chloroflexota bacterium]